VKMMFKLTADPLTKESFAEAVKFLHDNFDYQLDEVENWSIDYSGLQEGRGLTDDCDGFVNALTCLLFGTCNFNLDEISLCVMDANTEDDKKYDHIAVGVNIGGKEWFSHNWSDQVLSKRDIIFGGYEVDGGRAVGMDFIQYRLLSTGKNEWKKGEPKFV